MDFNNYNGESEEELYPHQSKTAKRIKFTFRYLLYGISALIWVGVFYMIFTSCDPGLTNKMVFSNKAREMAQKNPDFFTVYNLQPSDYMNYNGSIQIQNIYYAKDAKELELCVKFNMEKITNDKLNDALIFVLSDSDRNYYPAVNIMTDSNKKYGYARVSFGNVVLNLNDNKYYDYTTSHDWVSEYDKLFTDFTNSDTSDVLDDKPKGPEVTYTISIYLYDKLIEKEYATVQDGIVNINKAFIIAQYEKSIKYDPINEISHHNIFNNQTFISTKEYKY